MTPNPSDIVEMIRIHVNNHRYIVLDAMIDRALYILSFKEFLWKCGSDMEILRRVVVDTPTYYISSLYQ